MPHVFCKSKLNLSFTVSSLVLYLKLNSSTYFCRCLGITLPLVTFNTENISSIKIETTDNPMPKTIIIENNGNKTIVREDYDTVMKAIHPQENT